MKNFSGIKNDDQDKSAPFSIGFDAKRAFYNKRGLGNYSRNLLSAIVKEHPENRYYLFSPKIRNRIKIPDEESFGIVNPGNAFFRFFGFLWRGKYMTSDIRRLNLRIFHGLSGELPSGIEKSGAKSIVTIHDLIFIKFPELYSRIDAYIYKMKLIHACRVSDRIIAISDQTKLDIMDFLNVSPDKIVVIHQGCDRKFYRRYSDEFFQEIRQKYNLPENYILYVGSVEERKNLLGLCKAFHLHNIEVPLVVVGHKTEDYFRKVTGYIADNNMNNIYFRDNIQNEDLPVIYQNAECLVYPSFYEGFGIPILEALVSETPVITSTGQCFSEAGGPGTIYVDPNNHDEIGRAIIKVLNDYGLRRQMISAGIEHAADFKDEIILMRYIQLYRSVLY